MSASNLLFLVMLILGPLVSVSSSSWPLCWAGMEVGFLGLIPLLLLGSVTSSKEASLKYFCVQALASVFLFLTGGVIFIFHGANIFYALGFILSVSLKLGLFPGHFWVTSVIFGMDWVSCCLVLGPLKIPPFAFLSSFSETYPEYALGVLVLASLSAMMGAFLGNNQTNVRAMIGASSITHTGWMTLGCVFGGLWSYLAIYLVVLFLGLLFLWQKDNLAGALSILSMSGLPPFIMFVAKLTIVANSLNYGASFLFLSLPLLSAVLSLIFYLKFSYSFYLNEKSFPGKASIFALGAVNLLGVIWVIL
uniref:NADH-ubiquinone oxidoreductase chain 2 n=1 Tax=Trimusculus reticulatus TaxID=981059 RepID=G8HTG4_9EUPU|nr:NADH dehydrogenase subunit 2 [Trimusculus reticulatus]AEQ93940.1 NADH dehydrogenase subunit 2 [Trimusculus reticulatus]